MNIPDEAKETAAEAMWNLSDPVRKKARPDWATIRNDADWRRSVQYTLADARAALEAAAHHLMAEAWEEGFDRGREPDAYTEDANPYRSGAGE